jgi:hypothetical protein
MSFLGKFLLAALAITAPARSTIMHIRMTFFIKFPPIEFERGLLEKLPKNKHALPTLDPPLLSILMMEFTSLNWTASSLPN